MRTATILGKLHAEGKKPGKWVLLAGPDVPVTEQLKKFRGLRGPKQHEQFELVRYQESDGHAVEIRFMTPEAFEEVEEQRKANMEMAKRTAEERIKRNDELAKKQEENRRAEHDKIIGRKNVIADAMRGDAGEPEREVVPTAEELAKSLEKLAKSGSGPAGSETKTGDNNQPPTGDQAGQSAGGQPSNPAGK